jgi:parallel beta-helix repeat protein
MSIVRRAARLVGVLAACAPWACGAGAADLFIENQSHQVFDGGSYDRLIVRNSDSITVRNARFAIASYGSVVSIQNSSDVVVENSDIDGGGEACTGVSISNGENITIADNTVHDIADDGFEIYGGAGLMIRGNTVYRLLGKGTDSSIPGPCYNGHSDGLEIARVSNSTFTGNLIFDVRSTAAVFISNDASGPSAYCRDLVFTNNVFVTPESGFTMYAFQVDGLEIHNNVIWKGYYGGLAIGHDVTDMDVTNNVLHSINYSHVNPPYVPAEHRFRHNRVADVASWNKTPALFGDERGNTVGEPDFTVAPNAPDFGDASAWRQSEGGPPVFALSDFAPASDSALLDAGDGATAPPVDALGSPRPQGVAVDIGAIEHVPEPGVSALQGATIAVLALLARSRREIAR